MHWQHLNDFCTVQLSKSVILCMRKIIIPAHVTAWMDTADILSEISQAQKDNFCVDAASILTDCMIEVSQTVQFIKSKTGMVVTRGCGEGEMSRY